ncbi:unnamed protein product [Didymodactylos carnosus]|uniref:Uncharacterized protein n=1 Tax=Didymodactylos carnosus TaxID=1234261 RepID=A0A814BUB2_9BILA|nr:unnamed protein product [Didymodactylos carnosus]CAF3709864.1 unnamed protein product [Didymodactylos carnosus]
MIPYLIRTYFDKPPLWQTIHETNETNITTTNLKRPWHVKSIEFTYIYVSVVFYSCLILALIYALIELTKLYDDINNVLVSVSNNPRFIESDEKKLINLKEATNVEYFLAKIESLIGRTHKRKYRRNSVAIAYALMIIIVLSLTAVCRLLIYGFDEVLDSITAFSVIEVIIYSTFTIAYFIILSAINHLTTHVVIELLDRTKLDLAKFITLSTDIKEIVKARKTIEYLRSIIEHVTIRKTKYTVTVLTVVIDRSRIVQLLTLIVTAIVSYVVALVQRQLPE